MSVLSPKTIWAQDRELVFVTFEVFESKDVEVIFEKNALKFNVVQSETGQKYHVELELFDEVIPEDCTQVYTPRAIKCTLEKAKPGPFWPRLLKDKVKPHFLGIDFSRWVDEDYEDEDPEADMPINPHTFMNVGGFNDNALDRSALFEDEDEEEEENEEAPITEID